MLKVMDTGFATDHVAPATILSGSFEETHQAPQPWTEGRDGLERCDKSKMRRLLKCRLAWYGFRSVGVGSFRVLSNDTLFVDLLQDCGAVLCRVEVDHQSRVTNPSAGRALTCLLNSLPGPAGNDLPITRSMLLDSPPCRTSPPAGKATLGLGLGNVVAVFPAELSTLLSPICMRTKSQE